MRIIEKNSTFVISSGAYSSYSIDTVFQTKEVIDLQRLLDDYLLEHDEGYLDECQFCKWIEQQPYLQRCHGIYEWHISDYSKAITPVQVGILGEY